MPALDGARRRSGDIELNMPAIAARPALDAPRHGEHLADRDALRHAPPPGRRRPRAWRCRARVRKKKKIATKAIAVAM